MASRTLEIKTGMLMSLKEIRDIAETILNPLESYIRCNICWDENSPYYGGLLETTPITPHSTWPHASYRVASAYLKLYEAYKDITYWKIAKTIVNYLVKEQSDTGCWCGYTGYPKSAGWNEINAPPGSKLNVKMDNGTVLDIIRSPFSVFGTALYSKVIADALLIATEVDSESVEEWRLSFIKAAEFLRCMIDERGYWVGERAWNQRAAVAVTLFTASKILGPERYLKKAQVILDQILKAQYDSGEYPYADNKGRTYHYHALTLCFLNEVYEIFPDERVRNSVLRGLNWMWSMQKPNGDFDWSIHSPEDHKTKLLSTFGVALQATSPYILSYREAVCKALYFLKRYQNPNGGFPLKIGLKSSHTTHSGDILLGLAELMKWLSKIGVEIKR